MTQIWSGDSLEVTVTVYTPAGVVKDLTGATFIAGARERTAGTKVDGTATVSDATGGVVSVTFTAGTLTAGSWIYDVTGTLGSEVKTVSSEPVRVLASAQ